jgi:amidohydrolase
MNTRFASAINRHLPQIVALRRELHTHPEIAFEEKWTSGRIARFLEESGVSFQRGMARGNGIVATIKGRGERIVALRADIDALPIQEQTGLPYASQIPGRMHACGHDGHASILCGVARLLQENAAQLPGTVKLLFQPAEEITSGAALLVNEGALEGVSAVFGLHGWPELRAGHVGVRNGCLMAGSSNFHIEITGRGSHGANPGASIDPVVVAAHLTTALQAVVSRETNPWDAAVLTVGRIQAGTTTNIIPETAFLEGTFRTLSAALQAQIRAAIQRMADGVATAFRATAKVRFGESPCPPLLNDPAMTDLARRAIDECFGREKRVEVEHPSMGTEDFAYYLERAPGTFVFLGFHDGQEGGYPLLHNPRFDFNDAVLPTGMALMAELAVRSLEAPAGTP